MPRPTVLAHWVERIRVERANNANTSIKALTASLSQYEKPNDPAPSEGTVRKHANEFDSWTDEQKQPYRLVRWPETFVTLSSELPWQAAPLFFELYRERIDRPTVRLMKWFWRVSLAMGVSAPFIDRFSLAVGLAAAEMGEWKDEETARNVEAVAMNQLPVTSVHLFAQDDAAAKGLLAAIGLKDSDFDGRADNSEGME